APKPTSRCSSSCLLCSGRRDEAAVAPKLTASPVRWSTLRVRESSIPSAAASTRGCAIWWPPLGLACLDLNEANDAFLPCASVRQPVGAGGSATRPDHGVCVAQGSSGTDADGARCPRCLVMRSTGWY